MIIWDTCAIIAATDVDDQDHARCVELMRHTPRPLLVPYPVLTEVCYLLERATRRPPTARNTAVTKGS